MAISIYENNIVLPLQSLVSIYNRVIDNGVFTVESSFKHYWIDFCREKKHNPTDEKQVFDMVFLPGFNAPGQIDIVTRFLWSYEDVEKQIKKICGSTFMYDYECRMVFDSDIKDGFVFHLTNIDNGSTVIVNTYIGGGIHEF